MIAGEFQNEVSYKMREYRGDIKFGPLKIADQCQQVYEVLQGGPSSNEEERELLISLCAMIGNYLED